MPDRPSGKSGNFKVVDDQIVEMAEAWLDRARQAIRRKRAHFDVCPYAGGLRFLQHRYPAIRIFLPWRVHLLVKSGKSEMQDSRARPRKFKVIGCQEAAGAGKVEMRAPAGILGGEGICKGRSAPVEHQQPRAVEAFLFCLSLEQASVRVAPKQADGGHRHVRVKTLDADGKVAGRPSAANLPVEDQDLLLLARPAVDKLVVVGTPCTAGDEPDPVFRRGHPASGFRTGSVTSRSSS